MDKSHSFILAIQPGLWTFITLPVTIHQNKCEFVLKEGICGGGEKAVSGQTHKEGGEGGRGSGRKEGEKDLKESGRKAEVSDTEREKSFNLARCSIETLNLCQFLWKGKAG